MKQLLIGLIDFYKRFLSPFMGQHCRFYPTCSSYTRQALLNHGVFKGSWLGIKRILRCNPWFAGGVDEVPPITPRPPR
ncbi:MAG: membrane protein insertion efficiency factor YidD [Betaproteobacteria bacterium]|jgi:putative membrane protein insertion efficiency factor